MTNRISPVRLIARLMLVGVDTVIGTMVLVVLFLGSWQGFASAPALLVYGLLMSCGIILVAMLPCAAIWYIAVKGLTQAGVDMPKSRIWASVLTAFISAAVIGIVIFAGLYYDLPGVIAVLVGSVLGLSLVAALLAAMLSLLLLPAPNETEAE